MAKKNTRKRTPAKTTLAVKVNKVAKKPKKQAQNIKNKKTISPAKINARSAEKVPAKVSKAKTTTAKAPKPAKAAGGSSGAKGYTPDEYKKYKEQKQRLINLDNSELKELLKKNLQQMSGNKSSLIKKVADGIVLGRIPRCPNCFRGIPKYDYKTGKYVCIGYKDVFFMNCHSTFTKQELKRDPWEA